MGKTPHDRRIWADKGEMSDRNPRYVHAKLLSGSGYTPEPVPPPADWFEVHGLNVFPIEMLEADDWSLLECSEDISPASRIQIALEVMKGLQHVRDSKRVIIWDIKPEHVLISGFKPPDDVSHISINFIDLETIFLVDSGEFSSLGDPTFFTRNSIARQENIMLQGGIFDPEAEVIESVIDYIRCFTETSHIPSPVILEELNAYWSQTINPNFENFLECLHNILDRLVGEGGTLRSPE